jgi:hypothetical protein
MVLIRGITGGVGAVLLMWILVLCFDYWRTSVSAPRVRGLVAVAGGWDYLLHRPDVVILLTLAFGVGLYLTSRR